MSIQEINPSYFTDQNYRWYSKLFTLLNKHYLLSILFFFFLGKLLYFICYASFWYLDALKAPNLFNNLCQWDCGWYLSIINNGYQLTSDPVSGQANWAFFPLFPLVSKMLYTLFHNYFSIIVFNQVLLLGSLLLLYRYCVANYSKEIALTSVFLLAISFENIYFLSIYTESLFMFLSLLIISFIANRKYFIAGILCALLSATRPQGFLLAFPLLFIWFSDHDFKLNKKTGLGSIFLFLLSISGLLIYMLYLQFHVGDFFAFYHIQSAWGKNKSSWLHPYDILTRIIVKQPIEFILAVLSVYGAYFFYKRKKLIECIFLALLPFMVMSTQTLQSYTRYVFGLYCVYIFLAALAVSSYKHLFCLTLLMLILNVVITCYWFSGGFSLAV